MRVLRWLLLLMLVLVVGFVVWALFGFLGALGLAVLLIHGCWLPWRHAINGWTGEPKEKYYALRDWKYPPAAG